MLETAADYMTPWAHSVGLGDTLREVRAKLLTHDISALAVVDSGDVLLGVISRTDLLHKRRELGEGKAEALRAGDVMTREAIAVQPTLSVAAACGLMVERSVHRVFVTTGNRLEGVLSTRDIMLAIRDARLREPISTFSSHPIFTIGAYEPISEANELLRRARISGLVVTDLGFPIGIYTQREALASLSKPTSAAVESSMNPAIACAPPALPVFRAASQAVAMKVRRVISVADGEIQGVMTGLDFARARRSS